MDDIFLPKTSLGLKIFNFFKLNKKYNKIKINEFMGTDNLEALGVLYRYITDEKYSLFIVPTLKSEEYFDFLLRYFTLCFERNVEDDWVLNRFNAANELTSWFKFYFKDEELSKEYPYKLKKWMAKLYKEGDEEFRNTLVKATIEHLFEDDDILRFFEDWRQDPILKEGYEFALEWRKGWEEINKKRGSKKNVYEW